MSETNKKKPSINPGLVRSDSDYKQSKSSAISNPTKQLAVVALPTAEKESTFTEMYADSLKLTWLPMTADNIVIPLEITDKAEAKPKRVKAESKSETKHAAKTKFDKIEKVKPEKIAEVKPTDMEILMANTPILQEPVKEKSAFTEPVEFVNIQETPKREESNVFESINAIPVSQETQSTAKEDEKVLKEAPPYMTIDKVEVRTSVNSEGETIYMIGKSVYTESQFDEYMQGVYGKILAADCKKLSVQGTVYSAQRDGTYKDNNGNIITADELIARLSAK